MIIILPINLFLASKLRRHSSCGWLQNLVGKALERVSDGPSTPNADVIGQLLSTY
jgi:hypothetical protein